MERKLANSISFAMLMFEASQGRFASSVQGFGSPLLRNNTVITDAIPFDNQSSSAAIMGIMEGRRPPWPEHSDVTGRTCNLIQRCWSTRTEGNHLSVQKS